MEMNWLKKFGDEEFEEYYKSGEAEAVHIVRDLAKDVDTKGQWIDVLSFDGDILTKRKEGTHEIKVELFERMTKPAYTDNIDENRYLCWHAAHGDIDKHRKLGHHGPKYKVRCMTLLVKTEKGDGKKMVHTVLGSRRTK